MTSETESNIADLVKEKCVSYFEPSYIKVEDQSSGCGAKLELTIVSSKFKGKALLQRHRLVHSVVKDEGYMDSIHALTIHAYTDEQWEKKK